MSLVAMVLSIMTASGALVWGWWLGGMEGAARWLAAAGALWLLSEWRRLRWVGSLVLLVFIGAAAYGLWLGLPASLMLIGAVAALLGWDLSAFLQRMRRASPHDDLRGMERRHLGRVSIVAALSLVIAGLAAFVRVRLPFEVAVGLALLGTLGLTRLVMWIQRENDL